MGAFYPNSKNHGGMRMRSLRTLQRTQIFQEPVNGPRGFPCGASGKDPPINAGDGRDTDSTPWSGKYPGGGNGKPLQYAWLENSQEQRSLGAAVHMVAKSRIQLKRLSMHKRTWRRWSQLNEKKVIQVKNGILLTNCLCLNMQHRRIQGIC